MEIEKKPPESTTPFVQAWFTLNTVFSGVISTTNEQEWAVNKAESLRDQADAGAGREVVLISYSFLPCKLLTNVDWAEIKSKQISLHLFILII